MNIDSCFPFAAVAGQEKIKKALLLNVINPRIGGVLISGEKGTAKSTLVRGLANLTQDMRVVDLPLNITEDRLVGSLDIRKAIREGVRAFEAGLLHGAHRNFLYVDEVNLLSEHIVNILLEVSSTGVNTVEREGLSLSHPSRFILVGSMNPEEGLLRPQFTDRFGLYVEAAGEKDIDIRKEIIKRRLAYEKDTAGFCLRWKKENEAIKSAIIKAKESLTKVIISGESYKLAAQLAQEGKCAGHRAEIVLLETARALAAYEGQDSITENNILEAAALALPHRIREAMSLAGPEEEFPDDRAGDQQPDGELTEENDHQRDDETDTGRNEEILSGDGGKDRDSKGGGEAPPKTEDIRPITNSLKIEEAVGSKGDKKAQGKEARSKRTKDRAGM